MAKEMVVNTEEITIKWPITFLVNHVFFFLIKEEVSQTLIRLN